MKKLLLILILLIIIAGVVFYFGWVQFKVPPGQYGVMITKTGGVKDDVIESGDFVWRWEGLIPTNMKLYVFSPDSVTENFSLRGELPSGSTYAEFYEADIDFSYNIEISLTFAIKSEQLPKLVSEKDLQPEELDAFYERVTEHAGSLAASFFREKTENSDFISALNFDFAEFEETLLKRFQSSYPEIDFIQIRVGAIDMPDIQLYMTVRENYFDIMEIRHSVFAEQTEQTTEKEIDEIGQIEVLREYGKLLSEYPVLLQYLALKSGGPDIPVEELVPSEDD